MIYGAEAATTWHDEIRAVEASSTVDEALEGTRQSAAEAHDAFATALVGDAAAATTALDDRDEATAARCAAAAAARDAGTALATRVAKHRAALERDEAAAHAAHATHTAALWFSARVVRRAAAIRPRSAQRSSSHATPQTAAAR